MFTPLVALICISHLISLCKAFAGPGACSGACGNAHDPALIRRSDGTYFRFSTGGKIAIHSAPSITGPWTFRGAAIPAGARINKEGRNDLWAPDVTKIGSKYYLLYTVSKFGSQDSEIGYATSSTLDSGSWTDHGATGVSSQKGAPYNSIDGNLIVGANNSALMAFGSFWQDLFIVPVTLGDGTIRKAGSPRQIAYQPSGGHELEAPYVFPHQGAYYLFFSAGKCCGLDKNRPARGAEYRIYVCRAASPEGPYVDKGGKSCTKGGGTLVLGTHDNIYAPGGQGVYEDPVQGTVLYYHYVNTNIGYSDGQKKFGWNKIRWADGWPVT